MMGGAVNTASTWHAWQLEELADRPSSAQMTPALTILPPGNPAADTHIVLAPPHACPSSLGVWPLPRVILQISK
jgi:hypothetical protein